VTPDPSWEAPGNFSLTGGAEAMAQLLRVEPQLTAVFAESDEMAVGALMVLRDRGLQVPGDVSIVGFDDHELADFMGLTTVQQPIPRQGELAAYALLELLRGGPRESIVLPTAFVLRETTGPVPANPRRARALPDALAESPR
jgi:LacI family transcriptional regulator, repressor for deo operon, udp, cdd, tsx, nupC, and nupG